MPTKRTERFLRWLVGSEPAFVALDRVTLKQATDFTAQELDPGQGVIVKHATVDHSAFWQRVDEREARRRFRVVTRTDVPTVATRSRPRL